jgi:soluble lytic murein transglycosylase-like protein
VASLRAVARAALANEDVTIACDREVARRDRVAWQMSLAGYSAREIADVLEGRLARADLDRAQALRLGGYGEEAAATLLDRAIAARRNVRERRAARAQPRRSRPAPLPARYAAEIDRLSRVHGIDPALVRAVIAAESGGNARAVSPAGAIGLMQLMPATAAVLGVNPWDPLDNLRGGIGYLAGLLRTYRVPRDALIAYNAGPGHADRVREGLATLYDETRRYLRAIEGTYGTLTR